MFALEVFLLTAPLLKVNYIRGKVFWILGVKKYRCLNIYGCRNIYFFRNNITEGRFTGTYEFFSDGIREHTTKYILKTPLKKILAF